MKRSGSGRTAALLGAFPRPNRRTLGLLFLAIVALGALWFLVANPSSRALTQARQNLESDNAQYAKISNQLRLVRDGQTVAPEVIDKVGRAADTLLPSRPPTADETSLVWRSAELQGLKVTSFAAGQPVKASAYDPQMQYAQVSITASGSLAQIVAWLEVLRASPQMTVATVNSMASTGDGFSATVAVNVYATAAPPFIDQLQSIQDR